MTGSSDESIARVEAQLESAERALSSVDALSDRQAERVADRMDRLASQLLEVSPPPSMAAVHERLGTTAASREDFDALIEHMSPPDGEG